MSAPGSKRRSGQLVCPSVEAWSDDDYARATGFLQVLDEAGQASPQAPRLPHPELVRIFTGMLTSRLLDDHFLPMQRQGRISHYFEARGQEAGPIAGAHALEAGDYFVPGLREGAAALYRGLPLAQYVAQILGNSHDLGHGRQMPGHVGCKAIRHLSSSSCVASQIPHATGLAMAAKVLRERSMALCFFGDGATSEDDFHAGLNFAGLYRAPVVFVCQNNQWAGSTPVALQTHSASLAVKGLAYAIPSLRVDGNDVLAMFATIRGAVERAREGGGPTFIEAVTYRLGAHSSADDPGLYRAADEHKAWQARDPLLRFGRYLGACGALAAEAQAAVRLRVATQIRTAVASEEAASPPPLSSLFDDVYATAPLLLAEQRAELLRSR